MRRWEVAGAPRQAARRDYGFSLELYHALPRTLPVYDGRLTPHAELGCI